jgi:hypothetical protein
MRGGRKIPTEHQEQIGVGLSNGQVTSTRWRFLPPISALGAFRDFSTDTAERRELDEGFLKNTNIEPRLAYSLAKFFLLDGDTYRQFPLTICFHDLQKR